MRPGLLQERRTLWGGWSRLIPVDVQPGELDRIEAHLATPGRPRTPTERRNAKRRLFRSVRASRLPATKAPIAIRADWARRYGVGVWDGRRYIATAAAARAVRRVALLDMQEARSQLPELTTSHRRLADGRYDNRSGSADPARLVWTVADVCAVCRWAPDVVVAASLLGYLPGVLVVAGIGLRFDPARILRIYRGDEQIVTRFGAAATVPLELPLLVDSRFVVWDAIGRRRPATRPG